MAISFIKLNGRLTHCHFGAQKRLSLAKRVFFFWDVRSLKETRGMEWSKFWRPVLVATPGLCNNKQAFTQGLRLLHGFLAEMGPL
mmetsp:Transcript_25016/g.43720  ORF Transcript_25016/g.43720 Transcript_25016/m.43720 type:complete len:85 (+) Transcript_25016:41-295(+)